MKPLRRDPIRHTSRSRDAALRRVRNTNRWLIAGSALLTGLFADLAASAFAGHASNAAGASRRATGGHTATKPLKPPAQAPKARRPALRLAEHAKRRAPAEEAPAEERAPETSEPVEEAAPETAPEAAPEVESAPAPAEEPPVVSGGS